MHLSTATTAPIHGIMEQKLLAISHYRQTATRERTAVPA